MSFWLRTAEIHTMNTFDPSPYDGIAFLYEKWCSGDAAWTGSRQFYQDLLCHANGTEFLELGIGTGSIALSVLCSRPVHITGVDMSTEMLRICCERYEELLRNQNAIGRLSLIQKDMTDLSDTELYDCAILPFRTIGHLLSNHSVECLFANVYRALKPGGRFVLDHYMFNEKWAREHDGKEILMFEDRTHKICDRYDYDFDKGRMFCQIEVNGRCVDRFAFRWMDPHDIHKWATAAGFAVEQIFGEYDCTPWHEDSNEQIWLLRKWE